MVGRERSYQGKLRPGSRPLGLGPGGKDSRPPPISVAVGPGVGEGGKVLTSTGLTLLQVLVVTRTLSRGHQEVICVLGVKGGVGKEEGSRLGQQIPTATCYGAGWHTRRDPGLRHTLVHAPALSSFGGYRGTPLPPVQKEPEQSLPCGGSPRLLGINETAAGPDSWGDWTPDLEPQGWSKGTRDLRETRHRASEASMGRGRAGPGGTPGFSLTSPSPYLSPNPLPRARKPGCTQ